MNIEKRRNEGEGGGIAYNIVVVYYTTRGVFKTNVCKNEVIVVEELNSSFTYTSYTLIVIYSNK
jgi:hypothetical protein